MKRCVQSIGNATIRSSAKDRLHHSLEFSCGKLHSQSLPCLLLRLRTCNFCLSNRWPSPSLLALAWKLTPGYCFQLTKLYRRISFLLLCAKHWSVGSPGAIATPQHVGEAIKSRGIVKTCPNMGNGRRIPSDLSNYVVLKRNKYLFKVLVQLSVS